MQDPKKKKYQELNAKRAHLSKFIAERKKDIKKAEQELKEINNDIKNLKHEEQMDLFEG